MALSHPTLQALSGQCVGERATIMQIDLPTLMIASSFIAAMSGVFLIFAWLQTDRANGLPWWAAANIALASAIPLMLFPNGMPDVPRIVIGISLLNISPALIWAAACASNSRLVDIPVIGAGAAAWLILMCALPPSTETMGIQSGFNLLITAAYMTAAAFEFWRGRLQHLMARWPLIVFLVLHALSSSIGAIMAFARGPGNPGEIYRLWLAFLNFETLAFVVGTSIFLVAITRERTEMQHKEAASTDALTLVASRRVFFEEGERLLATSQRQDSALVVVLFDLDDFKGINDTFGHTFGDAVLKTFGRVALKTLRASDLVARLGGEEFGALLPGASVGAAQVAAERIRAGFVEAASEIGNGVISPTASAGIAVAHPGMTLEDLLHAADEALYAAKLHGRNRVEVAPEDAEQRSDGPLLPHDSLVPVRAAGPPFSHAGTAA